MSIERDSCLTIGLNCGMLSLLEPQNSESHFAESENEC